jgi:hypothetical protein
LADADAASATRHTKGRILNGARLIIVVVVVVVIVLDKFASFCSLFGVVPVGIVRR